MKLIVAVIQPTHLEEVKKALVQAGHVGFTLLHVEGIGHEEAHKEVYRGHEYPVKFQRRIQMEIAVDDKHVEEVVTAIVNHARSRPEGKLGDGRVFVMPLDHAVNIRTGKPDVLG